MHVSTPPIPLTHLSFPGYVHDEQGRGERVWFASLGHFFEAEKFRGQQPDIWAEIVNSPTLREARKTSRRHRELWRGDWSGIRGRVVVCAMQYAAWADPDPQRWEASQASALVESLAALDLPPRFCSSAVTAFHLLAASPMLCFFGVDKAPDDAVGQRVNALHRKHQHRWRMAHWLGRHTSWKLHRWALEQHIPMRYVGQPGDRLTDEALSEVLHWGTHATVFEARGSRYMEGVTRVLRARKFPTDMVYFTPT